MLMRPECSNDTPLLHLLSVISQFSKLKSAPLCELIKKNDDPLSRVLAQLVFDMKHKIAHVPSHNDSISLQLPQVLSQHLLRSSRNKPRELTQPEGGITIFSIAGVNKGRWGTEMKQAIQRLQQPE